MVRACCLVLGGVAWWWDRIPLWVLVGASLGQMVKVLLTVPCGADGGEAVLWRCGDDLQASVDDADGVGSQCC